MKKNLLKLFMTVLVVMGAAQWAAAETINQLVVTCASGDVYYIALDETPKVYLEEEELYIRSSSLKVTLDATEQVKFSWGDKAGLESLKLNNAPTFYWDSESLRIYGLKAGESVALYSIDGITLYSGRADQEGCVEISLQGRKGVTIVKTASQTIKFTR